MADLDGVAYRSESPQRRERFVDRVDRQQAGRLHFPTKARQDLLVESWRRAADQPFIDDETHRIRTNIDDRHRGAKIQPTLRGRRGQRGGLMRDRAAEGGCEGMIL